MESTQQLIDRYNASGRVAHLYPRKGRISLNGGPSLPIAEAVKRMQSHLLPQNKPIHGLSRPRNLREDAVSTPPVPCEFQVGDLVRYTNGYGATVDLTVRGFTPTVELGRRFVLIFTDCWWFPADPNDMVLLSRPKELPLEFRHYGIK